MGTSTGGTLTAALAQDKAAIKNIAGFIFISPNFAINNRAATLLTWPFARHWVPLIIGDWQKPFHGTIFTPAIGQLIIQRLH